jgi:hypothetical protein
MIRTSLVSSVILLVGLAPAGLEKVKLAFKHEEGSSRSVESTSKTNQVLSIMGQDVVTKSENKLTIVTSVGKRGANGRLPIEQKIEAINLQLNTPVFNVTFDSSNPNQKDDNPMIQAIIDTIRARLGTSHTVVLDENNKVVGIEGIDKILAKASPAAAESLKAELDPEQMKKAAEQAFGILPAEPVAEGDTWTRTLVTSIGGGQTLTFETKFEYLGTAEKGGRKLDKIATTAQSVTYAMAPNPQAQVKITQSNLKIESSKGMILFDRAKGIAVESNSIQHVVGDMTLSIAGMDLPSKLDLTLDSSSIVK